MRKSDIFLGALLLVLGLIFLGINYNLFDFDLFEVARFWPILVILAGVALIFSDSKSFFNPTSTILLLIAIPLSIYYGVKKGTREIMSNFDNNFYFDDGNNGELNFGQNGNEGEMDEEFEKFNPDLDNAVKQDYEIPIKSGTKKGYFELGGGAAKFNLNELNGGSTLFKAKTNLKGASFNLSDDFKGDTQEIKFEMSSKKGSNLNSDFAENNEVDLYLNNEVPWAFDLGIGASDLNFDLSQFKIEKLDINSGAANIEIKLGKRQKNCKVEINSGVASVNLKIPKNVGCKLKMDGLLNSNDFEGFIKKGNGMFETANYNNSSETITIDVNSALSSLKINRY